MISPAEYQIVARLLLVHSGLALGEGKEYLLESRLAPVAALMGLPDLASLFERLRHQRDPRVVEAVCEAMTTNESLFFRDDTPFRLLREEVLPGLVRARAGIRRLRIWSAGASTGQEPYSVAMTIAAHFAELAGWSVEILATDYSQAALERARAGRYSAFEIQRGLPVAFRSRFFRPVGDEWQIGDEILRAVRFQRGNLLEPFGGWGSFDLIFCRNVLIYFDVPTKRDVLERMTRQLASDGFLFLGASETAVGITDRLERVEGMATSVYRPRASVQIAS